MSIKKNEQIENWNIDEDLFETIRLASFPVKFGFGENLKESRIVPKNFTHHYLITNFDVSENILRYYYNPVNGLITDKEYEDYVNSGYHGAKYKMLNPFGCEIFGAFHFRKSLMFLLKQIKFSNYTLEISGVKIEYFNQLIPFFEDYAKGFRDGFNKFDDDCINPYLIPNYDKNDIANKVFEYITKTILFKHSWYNQKNFSMSSTKKENTYEIAGGKEHGLKAGYFYKAWCRVFSSHRMFEPLFKELNYNIKTKHNKNVEKKYSALEWATIFYYADETKLLPETKFKKNRMEQFMNSHNIATTFKNFKAKYHTVKKRINKDNNYPLSKLKLILPFLKDHYNQTVTKVENDITFLETEQAEN